jgi:hypothetical protein
MGGSKISLTIQLTPATTVPTATGLEKPTISKSVEE